jgi:hypothetical protein
MRKTCPPSMNRIAWSSRSLQFEPSGSTPPLPVMRRTPGSRIRQLISVPGLQIGLDRPQRLIVTTNSPLPSLGVVVVERS